MDNTSDECRPDRTEELRMVRALRRVAQFDAGLVAELCGCRRCHLCNFVSLESPEATALANGLRYGSNTPDGE